MNIDLAKPLSRFCNTWKNAELISLQARYRPAPLPHLRAAAVAITLIGLLVLFGVCGSHYIERRYINTLALESSHLKDQGIVWQRDVFAEAELLPFYGSSELLQHFGNEPQHFFGSYPTNFAVSPNGRAGCTSLILLEKIAAAGNVAHGQKLVVCLSPSWFFHPRAPDRWYEGNFSWLQVNQLIFSGRLSMALKKDLARRMLNYPETVEKSPLLSFAMHRLADGGFWNLGLYQLIKPLGRLQTSLGLVADHFEFCWYIMHDHELAAAPARRSVSLDWSNLFAAAERQAQAEPEGTPDRVKPRFASDKAFLNLVENAGEWIDLELLLRTCKELSLKPLVISIPMDSEYFEEMGVSKACLDVFLLRLRELARRYDIALVDFADHQQDHWFLADHHDHFSAKGWMFVNKELEGFYHASDHSRQR